jgi:hypothetical protein
MAINKARNDGAPITINWLCLRALINLILWAAPHNVAFVVGYKTCIVDNAKRAVAN